MASDSTHPASQSQAQPAFRQTLRRELGALQASDSSLNHSPQLACPAVASVQQQQLRYDGTIRQSVRNAAAAVTKPAAYAAMTHRMPAALAASADAAKSTKAAAAAAASALTSQADSKQSTAQHGVVTAQHGKVTTQHGSVTAQPGAVTASSFLALCLEAASKSPSVSPQRRQRSRQPPAQVPPQGNAGANVTPSSCIVGDSMHWTGANPVLHSRAAETQQKREAPSSVARPAQAYSLLGAPSVQPAAPPDSQAKASDPRTAKQPELAKHSLQQLQFCQRTVLDTSASQPSAARPSEAQPLTAALSPAQLPHTQASGTQLLEAQRSDAQLTDPQPAYSSSGQCTQGKAAAKRSRAADTAQQQLLEQQDLQVKPGVKRSRPVATAQLHESKQQHAGAKAGGKHRVAAEAEQQHPGVKASSKHRPSADTAQQHPGVKARRKHSPSVETAQQQNSGVVADSGTASGSAQSSQDAPVELSREQAQQPNQAIPPQAQHAGRPSKRGANQASPAESKLSTVIPAGPSVEQHSTAMPADTLIHATQLPPLSQQEQSKLKRKPGAVRKCGLEDSKAAVKGGARSRVKSATGPQAQPQSTGMVPSLSPHGDKQGTETASPSPVQPDVVAEPVLCGKQEILEQKAAAGKRLRHEPGLHNDLTDLNTSKRQMRSRGSDHKPWWVV